MGGESGWCEVNLTRLRESVNADTAVRPPIRRAIPAFFPAGLVRIRKRELASLADKRHHGAHVSLLHATPLLRYKVQAYVLCSVLYIYLYPSTNYHTSPKYRAGGRVL